VTDGRGRVVRGVPSAGALGPLPAAAPRGGARLEREVVSAQERARTILTAAERRARAILEHAERGAADARLRAEELGRARGLAEVSAWSLRLKAREDELDRRALDRSVELARLLAERLLGAALELSPELVVSLAREAFAEVRAARRVRLFANPEDVALLERAVAAFDPEAQLSEIAADPELARGDLRLETDVGVLDAKLGAELDRLAARLREAIDP